MKYVKGQIHVLRVYLSWISMLLILHPPSVDTKQMYLKLSGFNMPLDFNEMSSRSRETSHETSHPEYDFAPKAIQRGHLQDNRIITT